MCYGKFTELQFLTKEYEMRKNCRYQNETANFLDFISLFMKITRSEFCESLNDRKGYKTDKIVNSTVEFLKEMETLIYEICKLALSDCFVKRYLKSYVSAAIVIASFEILVDKIDQSMKIDMEHIRIIYQIL
jgi:hypothetical protein